VTQGGPVRLVRAELRGIQVPANQVGLDVAGGRGRGAVSSGACVVCVIVADERNIRGTTSRSAKGGLPLYTER
jgi:hypothetical protein